MSGPETVLLMGPGPSPVSDRVLRALARPPLGHLDPRFLMELDEASDRLRRLFGSSERLTFPISGTGSAAMEAAVMNLVFTGRRVVVLRNGVFGDRIAEMARRAGGEVEVLEFPEGAPVDPAALPDALSRGPALVCVVHAETSTGARSDIDALAPIVASHGSDLLVDAVTSLGGLPVEMDKWGAAVVYGGSQKCLAAPPGLGPISMSAKALGALARDFKPHSWYLDLGLIARYIGSDRVYHHTAPVNMVFGLAEALRAVEEEAALERFARHRRAGAAMRAGLLALGMRSAVVPGAELPMLSVVFTPEGQPEAEIRRELLLSEGVEIGGGLGRYAGKVFRIGTMGEGARIGPVLRTLSALARVMNRRGLHVFAKEAAQAARSAWEETP